jgi:hypothetical protein
LASSALPADQAFFPTALHPSGWFCLRHRRSRYHGRINQPHNGPGVSSLSSPFGDIGFDQMAVDPSGKYGFATSFPFSSTLGGTSVTLVTFAIDQTTGRLSILNSSTFPSPTPFTFGGVLAHPSREFLYVSNTGTAAIDAYSIAANGSLSSIAGSPFATGGVYPSRMVTDANGKFLYVGNGTQETPGSISGFMVDQTSGARLLQLLVRLYRSPATRAAWRLGNSQSAL